jgi:nitrile hydratase accessory protein
MSGDWQISQLPPASSPPRTNGELVFEAPWHARAFGMAALLTEQGLFEWDLFRDALIASIAESGQTGSDQYYACWLQALVTTLEASGTVDESALRQRAFEFATHARDEVF